MCPLLQDDITGPLSVTPLLSALLPRAVHWAPRTVPGGLGESADHQRSVSFQSLLCSEDRRMSQAWWLLSCGFQSSVVGVMPCCSWQLQNSFPPPVPLPEVCHFCVMSERSSFVSGLTPGHIRGAHLPKGCGGPPAVMLPPVCLQPLLSAPLPLPLSPLPQGRRHSQPCTAQWPEQHPLPAVQHIGRKTLIDFEWLHHFYQNGSWEIFSYLSCSCFFWFLPIKKFKCNYYNLRGKNHLIKYIEL